MIEDTRARRRRPRLATAVAVALALLAVGQGAAALAPRGLPDGAVLSALPNGYSYSTQGRQVVLGFQLTNDGTRSLRVSSLGGDLPGLSLVDVTVSGEPFDYASVGEGAAPLPAFALSPGTVVEVRLVYLLEACNAVPREPRPMPVVVSTDGGSGTLRVALPRAPSSDADAGPDDEDEWQVVLVRDVCG